MESNCAGLILHRQKPPLTRRSLVYYCSGVHSWMKTVGLLRKLRHRGRQGVGWIFTLTAAAYNLIRIRNLARAAPAGAR